MRALFYVQHLLGIGHVVRTMRIAAATAHAGGRVLVVMGGEPVPDLYPTGVEIVELPSLKAAPGTFKILLNADGVEADATYMANRLAVLEETLRRFYPDIVIVEAFPFDRPQMHGELVPFLESAQAMSPAPLIASSIRDILQRKDKPERDAKARDLLERFFDHVFVHGDGQFATLAETYRHASEIRAPVHYTGIVGPSVLAHSVAQFDVIVSAGGGAVGSRLLESAMSAKTQTTLRAARWLAVSGPNLPVDVARHLQELADHVGVELRTFVPGLADLLGRATLSISQAGYNTVADILHARCRAVLCPFAGIGQNEQAMRAERLAARGLAIVVEENGLDEPRMRAAIEAALLLPMDVSEIDLGGAERTAALILRLAQQRNT